MDIRLQIQKREDENLSQYAAKASCFKGRAIYEPPDKVRTEFQRDRDRIIHSKSFRRLMHKTQVFLSPEGDHFRTRLTHTIEVSQISRTIAKALNLNEDLTEAIALGHDLGHTPFGHSGEAVLNRIHKGGFKHNVQSLRVCDCLEQHNGRRGINLTYEVRDGILNHTGSGIPFTLEGQIVKISDRIAYINHDIDDALRSNVISEKDLPKEQIKYLGNSHGLRIDTMVTDIIKNSFDKDKIIMSDECLYHMNKLRSYMFENVYRSEKIKKVEEVNKLENVITSLYGYYNQYPEKLPEDYFSLIYEYGTAEVVKDYIAGMTDRYSIMEFNKAFVPENFT